MSKGKKELTENDLYQQLLKISDGVLKIEHKYAGSKTSYISEHPFILDKKYKYGFTFRNVNSDWLLLYLNNDKSNDYVIL